ncbi:ABC transporter permease [Spiroplasma endosymbiont of Labia minor]|uniref:ABC transporter permease n=1 Tax=Spiroplasma endosymbiont of Labia minor TaxID=3066305 RepID=UPI0030D00E00
MKLSVLTKNYLIGIFKEKLRLWIIIILIFLSFLISLTGVAITKNIDNSNSRLVNQQINYDYQFDYSARTSDNSKNKKSITPWFLFDSKTQSIKLDENNSYHLSTISMGDLEDDVFYTLDKSDFEIINNTFKFNSIYGIYSNINWNSAYVKNTTLEKLKTLADIGDTKASNYLSYYLTLLSQLSFEKYIDNYFNELTHYWRDKGLSGDDLKNKIINLSTNNDSNYSNQIDATNISGNVDYNLPLVKVTINNDEKIVDYNDLYENGLKGNFGQLALIETLTDSGTATYDIGYLLGNHYEILTGINMSDISPTAGISYSIDSLYSSSWLSSEYAINLTLFSTYYEIIAYVNNFNMTYRNEIIFFDSHNNEKAKFVDKTKINTLDENNFENNSANLIFYKKSSTYSEYDQNSIVIGSSYAYKNHLSVNDNINFQTTTTQVSWNINAIGTDVNDVYPLIYDSDYLTSSKNELIIYATYTLFSNKTIIADNDVKENSRVLLNYLPQNKNEMQSDLNNFKESTATDFLQINQPINAWRNNFSINEYNNSHILLVRNSLNEVSNLFSLIFLTMFIIFFVLVFVSLWILLSYEIKKDAQRIGILKAMGYRNTTMSLCYSLYVLAPTLIAAIFAYPLMLGLQKILIYFVSTFFSIPADIIFLPWQTLFLIISIIIFLFAESFFMVLFKLKISVLNLIYSIEKDKETRIAKFADKVNIKKFTSRLTLKLFLMSASKIIGLNISLTIAALIGTLIVLIPSSVNKIKNDYWSSSNYSSRINYQEPIYNLPFSKYNIYESNGLINNNNDLNEGYPHQGESLLPQYYSIHTNDNSIAEIKNTADVNLNEVVDKELYGNTTYNTAIANLFGFNFLSIYNKSFNIGMFQNIVNTFTDSSGEDHSDLTALVTNFSCQVLPSTFNVEILATDWRQCVVDTVRSQLPASMIKSWTDVNTQTQFSFDFNRTSYNQKTDELFTKFKSNIGHSTQIDTFGIKNDSKMIKVDTKKLSSTNTNIVNVAITQKLAKLLNLSLNDNFNAEIANKEMRYVTKGTNENQSDITRPIKSEWWFYKEKTDSDDYKLVPLDEVDLAHLTYGNIDQNYGQLDGWYKTSTGEYKKYNLIQNVRLLLPGDNNSNEDVDPNKFANFNNGDRNLFSDNNVVEAPKTYSFLNDGLKYYEISPFDWWYQIGSGIESIYDIFSYGGTPNSWYDSAFNHGLFKIENLIKNVDYTVKQIVDIYDENLILMNQENANSIMNYSYKENEINKSWFNGKFSQDTDDPDVFGRIGLSSTNGSYNLSNFNNNVINQSANYYLLGAQKNLFNEIFYISLIICLIFLIIIILASVVSISMISNLFILQYRKMISLMRVIGYSDREINQIILRLLLPNVGISIFIGAIIPSILLFIVEKILWNLNIMLPISFSWFIPLLIVIIGMSIFFITYILVYKFTAKIPIQEEILLQ